MTDPRLIIAIVLLQTSCAGVLIWEIAISILGINVAPINWQLYEIIEICAALGLMLGGIVGGLILRRSWQNQRHISDQLRVASGAFMDVVEDRFTEWALTPAERDVALFSIKGLTLSDIASVRETSEGTVKAQTNAIYRKAGVSSRSQLLSLFIDDLMQDALVPQPASNPSKAAAS